MPVTIAIPFYNAELYLANAIQSVFAQTYTDWELLLIDDGSTDNSLEIAKSIKDPRVKVFSDGKNKRLAARLNEVTSIAKFDYIARMDADDLMDPDRIRIQFDILEKNQNFDLTSCGTYSILNNYTVIGKRGMDYDDKIEVADILLGKVRILHAGILARKKWFERNRYNEKLELGQDTYMWTKAASLNDFKIKLISDPLYIYREENSILTSKLLRAYKNEREYLSQFIHSDHLRYKFLMKSYIKTFLISVFGAPKYLIERRNGTIDFNERAKLEQIYKKIFNQTIK